MGYFYFYFYYFNKKYSNISLKLNIIKYYFIISLFFKNLNIIYLSK